MPSQSGEITLFLLSLLPLLVLCLLLLNSAQRERRRQRALRLPVIHAAARFWTEVLCRKRVDEAKLKLLEARIRELLADAYVNGNSTFPDIGVYYWRPHHYGVDPLLLQAGADVGIYSNRLMGELPHLHMRLTEACIQIRATLAPEEFREIWTREQPVADIVAAARVHRCRS